MSEGPTFTRRVFVLVTAVVLVPAPVSQAFAAPEDSFPAIGSDRYSTRYESTTDTYYIEGDDFDLTPDLLPASKHIVVRGGRISLAGTLTTKGQSLTIIARELTSVGGATIITIGPDGEGKKGVAAKIGESGLDGGDGTPGGDVTVLVGTLSTSLHVDASGGAGGAAGNGGEGTQGTAGPNATRQSIGGDGGKGGLGGLAGKPGNGGNGGKIFIGALTKIEPATVSWKSAGGAAGEPGKNGPSGAGGFAGNPLDWDEKEPDDNPGKGGPR